MKNFEYKVAFERKGFLYIKMKNTTRKFENPYDYIPENVELVKISGMYYIKGFEPKKKKNSVIKIDNDIIIEPIENTEEIKIIEEE